VAALNGWIRAFTRECGAQSRKLAEAKRGNISDKGCTAGINMSGGSPWRPAEHGTGTGIETATAPSLDAPVNEAFVIMAQPGKTGA
jgi:hypothetical protein